MHELGEAYILVNDIIHIFVGQILHLATAAAAVVTAASRRLLGEEWWMVFDPSQVGS